MKYRIDMKNNDGRYIIIKYIFPICKNKNFPVKTEKVNKIKK